MFVDRIPFLATMSRGIIFITTKHIPMQNSLQLKQSLLRVLQIHSRAGFMVQTILVDGQFESLKEQLSNTVVNTTANLEHVGDIEQCLQLIKERARATI
ncbi:hypothetical protein ACHAXS_004562, partial [Conticribra weissflogii]